MCEICIEAQFKPFKLLDWLDLANRSTFFVLHFVLRASYLTCGYLIFLERGRANPIIGRGELIIATPLCTVLITYTLFEVGIRCPWEAKKTDEL